MECFLSIQLHFHFFFLKNKKYFYFGRSGYRELLKSSENSLRKLSLRTSTATARARCMIIGYRRGDYNNRNAPVDPGTSYTAVLTGVPAYILLKATTITETHLLTLVQATLQF